MRHEHQAETNIIETSNIDNQQENWWQGKDFVPGSMAQWQQSHFMGARRAPQIVFKVHQWIRT